MQRFDIIESVILERAPVRKMNFQDTRKTFFSKMKRYIFVVSVLSYNKYALALADIVEISLRSINDIIKINKISDKCAFYNGMWIKYTKQGSLTYNRKNMHCKTTKKYTLNKYYIH